MLRLLIILSLLRRACLSDVISQGDTDVVFGQNAFFSCTLPHASGVKHVTWQRVRADEPVQTLATFSERVKDTVDVGKVTLALASFNSTSIVIKNTTFEDEACYICSFKVYPSRPKRQTLCLTVKGISEITAEVNPSPASDSDVVVSCSATGKPTPTIKWKSSEKEMNDFRSNNLRNLNNDSSTTVTSNITLPLSEFHGKTVECLALSDRVEKRFQIHMPEDDEDKENVTLRKSMILMLVMVIFSIAIIAFYLHTKLNAKDQKCPCTP